ncbi:MAG: OmpA family protein [Sphingobacteriales bacterium]|nr:OmpA family protein [Sphingobacteriales bacterium]
MNRLTRSCALLFLVLLVALSGHAQPNLLLNGGFDDVNVCTEYKAECGVEGWFYLKDVKVQMLANDTVDAITGTNSITILYNWIGYSAFTPVFGSILPCRLQAGKSYTLKGLMNVRLNPKLQFKAGVCFGDWFYVPRRPFASTMKPDSIVSITQLPNSNFVEFDYHFTATGQERYFTFGSYIHKDSLTGKAPLTGTQTINMILDRFSLTPDDPEETLCAAFAANKALIYQYNFRHKEMDYSLYGRGQLAIEPEFDNNSVTVQRKEPVFTPVKTDTLQLGDVLFDFNKAILKPAAVSILKNYFTAERFAGIDSIRIEGHTDSIGTDNRNNQLSGQRSEAVKNWLLQNGWLPGTLLTVHGYGRTRPVASNQTAAGRAQNRRVELILFRKKELPQQ